MDEIPYLTALNSAQLASRGIPADWPYGVADRVRFDEIDGLGHVNHRAYLTWFETIRVYYLADYDITRLDGEGPSVVVKSLTAAYHAPMFLGQDYVVTARTPEFRNTSFTMEYGVFTEGRLVVEGTALIVQVAPHSTDKLPLSEAVRQTLITRDGAKPV